MEADRNRMLLTLSLAGSGRIRDDHYRPSQQAFQGSMILTDLADGESVFLDANILVYHFAP